MADHLKDLDSDTKELRHVLKELNRSYEEHDVAVKDLGSSLKTVVNAYKTLDNDTKELGRGLKEVDSDLKEQNSALILQGDADKAHDDALKELDSDIGYLRSRLKELGRGLQEQVQAHKALDESFQKLVSGQKTGLKSSLFSG